ncbi:hypothetical protein EVA_06501 [gut metagenome]|uniref:Uncharacterized protein n=1 Tax=gut metagenome TaxID=749906 RepID=J9CYP9_9ZZZZ
MRHAHTETASTQGAYRFLYKTIFHEFTYSLIKYRLLILYRMDYILYKPRACIQ